jgi:hypothetical protein
LNYNIIVLSAMKKSLGVDLKELSSFVADFLSFLLCQVSRADPYPPMALKISIPYMV